MTLDELRAAATVQVGEAHTWPPPLGHYSMTLEDAEFLYALVRMTKPGEVIESGTGLGVSAKFIGEALKQNGHGTLTTYEPVKEYADQARGLVEGLPVQVVRGECAPRDADLVLIDSGPGSRPREIREWLESACPGLILVHDSNRGYDALKFGVGAFLDGSDGFWVGRCG